MDVTLTTCLHLLQRLQIVWTLQNKVTGNQLGSGLSCLECYTSMPISTCPTDGQAICTCIPFIMQYTVIRWPVSHFADDQSLQLL